MPGVPWSSSGALQQNHNSGSPNPFLSTPSGVQRTSWERGTDAGRGDGFIYGDELGYGELDGEGDNLTFDMDMVTEVDGEVDEDVRRFLAFAS